MANEFSETIGSLFKGMDAMLTTKTVVGEPTQIGDTIILPLVDVNFGCAAGAFTGKNASNSAGGGMGGKMSPSAVLVINNGHARMVSVKSEDMVSKIIDMVPDIVDKIGNLIGKGAADNTNDEEVDKAIDEISKETNI